MATLEEECESLISSRLANPTSVCKICGRIWETGYHNTECYVCPECDEELNKE